MGTTDAQAARITLRALRTGDCERLLSWIPDEDALLQWAGPVDFSWPLDPGQLVADARGQSDERRLLAAVDPRTGELVGHVKLQVQHRHRSGHIGRVLISPERRGRGLGAALISAVVDLGLGELGLHRLHLGVYAFNAPAIATYEAAGFVVEGRLRDAALGSTGYWDALVMGLLDTDPRPARGSSPAP